jgi:hypothetical protein
MKKTILIFVLFLILEIKTQNYITIKSGEWSYSNFSITEDVYGFNLRINDMEHKTALFVNKNTNPNFIDYLFRGKSSFESSYVDVNKATLPPISIGLWTYGVFCNSNTDCYYYPTITIYNCKNNVNI